MGRKSKGEGIYVYIQLIHFAEQQQLTQCCQATILQFKNQIKKKNFTWPGPPLIVLSHQLLPHPQHLAPSTLARHTKPAVEPSYWLLPLLKTLIPRCIGWLPVFFKYAQIQLLRIPLNAIFVITTHFPRIPDLSFTPQPFLCSAALFYYTVQLLIHCVVHLPITATATIKM